MPPPPPRRRLTPGFSFVEMVTVVAIISVVVSAAVPIAGSLFQRRRELLLRETLLLMRQGIREFEQNLRDDDSDGEIDEDPRGDLNRDGFPGLRGIDDNADLVIDGDWKGRTPFDSSTGRPDPQYDWRLRSDDDEDMSRDEEAFPSDIFDLVNRTTILRGRIPRDPTTKQPSWNQTLLTSATANTTAANNDLDWSRVGFDIANIRNEPLVLSLDAVYVAADDVHLNPSATAISDGTNLAQVFDEDPRNGIDDDGDGRRDEDPSDLVDVSSQNPGRATNLTTYSEW